MNCYRCGGPFSLDDNYCRRCGAALRSARLPVPGQAYPLAPWQGWRPLAVRGAAGLAVGALFPWLLRRLARRALGSRLPAVRAGNGRSPASRTEKEPLGEATVGEFIFFRRITIRR